MEIIKGKSYRGATGGVKRVDTVGAKTVVYTVTTQGVGPGIQRPAGHEGVSTLKQFEYWAKEAVV